MIFSEGLEIQYKDMYGVVDFICNSYIIMKLDSASHRNPARLLIYRENYNQIQVLSHK